MSADGGGVATLGQLADAVGLPAEVVSRALIGDAVVDEQTRRLVVEAARARGYSPLAALASDRQAPFVFGLVVKHYRLDVLIFNRFYAPMLAGIEDACRAHAVEIEHASMEVDMDNKCIDVPPIFSQRRCDGFLVLGARLDAEAARQVAASGRPVVLADSYADAPGFDSAVIDNVGGARAAVRYLVEAGHREIALVGTERNAYPSIRQRRRGYEDVIEEHDLVPWLADSPYVPPDSAADVGERFIAAHPEVTAAFCANDGIALTLLQQFRFHGGRVPEQLSIVGFDDIDLAGLVTPSLTTMAVDKPGLGRMAVGLLAQRFELGPGRPIEALVEPQLVERESVRRIG